MAALYEGEPYIGYTDPGTVNYWIVLTQILSVTFLFGIRGLLINYRGMLEPCGFVIGS